MNAIRLQCHPERSEGPMDSFVMHRSLASLKMTTRGYGTHLQDILTRRIYAAIPYRNST